MSHFCCVVFLPHNTEDIKQGLCDALAPFNEALEGEEEEVECFCTYTKGEVDPECDECGGTGTLISTSNPDAHWDWWVIGGRWTGELDGYDPQTDPDNWEQCYLCDGTGMRNDELGIKERERNLSYTCNGCDGKGTRLVFRFKGYDGDISILAKIRPDFIPFAFIDLNGEWHENGGVGWFGIVKDEKAKNEWETEWMETLKLYPDNTIAVLVDCHI